MTQHEPLNDTDDSLFWRKDVLSALSGLKEEITGAMFTIPTLKDLSDDRKNACLMSLGSTLKSIDKWFPIAQNEEKGVLK